MNDEYRSKGVSWGNIEMFFTNHQSLIASHMHYINLLPSQSDPSPIGKPSARSE